MRMNKNSFLFFMLIVVLLFPVAAFAEGDAETVRVDAGSVLFLKLREGAAVPSVFGPFDGVSKNPRYTLEAAAADSCVPDEGNMNPESRELGTVLKNNVLNYDLSFPLDNVALRYLRFVAKSLKFKVVYEKQDGTEGVWESSLGAQPNLYFVMGGASPEDAASISFVTRDALQLLFEAVDFKENSAFFRFYALGDRLSKMNCWNVITVENEKPSLSTSCTDAITANAERRMNVLDVRAEFPGLSENDRFKSIELQFERPSLVASFTGADGAPLERTIAFGDDFSVTYHAMYEIAGYNRCLNYEVY